LTEWFPAFLATGAGIKLPTGPPVDDDPVAADERCPVQRQRELRVEPAGRHAVRRVLKSVVTNG
jgi:hypothetical protein